jgi:prophage antirepressor-like protein
MVDKFIDIHNKILHYSKIYVYIAFDDKTNEPWFQASRLCKLFKYTNPQKAIRDNVNKQNRNSLENIVKKI